MEHFDQIIKVISVSPNTAQETIQTIKLFEMKHN